MGLILEEMVPTGLEEWMSRDAVGIFLISLIFKRARDNEAVQNCSDPKKVGVPWRRVSMIVSFEILR